MLGDELSVSAIGFGATALTPAYGEVNDESLPDCWVGFLTAVIDVVGAAAGAAVSGNRFDDLSWLSAGRE